MSTEISCAIYDLQEVFLEAHAQATWQREKMIELLTGIHDMTKNPRGTQGDELFRMGEKAMVRGMPGQAIGLLCEAIEKNPLDFRAYISLGLTYSRQEKFDQAYDNFVLALKNAQTDYYKCYSVLLMGRAQFCMRNFDKAAALLQKAIKASPRYWEAYYQAARCLAAKALEGAETDVTQMIRFLEQAIRGHRSFFVKAQVDDVFDDVRGSVDKLLAELSEGAKRKAEEILREAERAVANGRKRLKLAEDWDVAVDRFDEGKYRSVRSKAIKEAIIEVTELLRGAEESLRDAHSDFVTSSFFGYLASVVASNIASEKVRKAQKLTTIAVSLRQQQLKERLSGRLRRLEEDFPGERKNGSARFGSRTARTAREKRPSDYAEALSVFQQIEEIVSSESPAHGDYVRASRLVEEASLHVEKVMEGLHEVWRRESQRRRSLRQLARSLLWLCGPALFVLGIGLGYDSDWAGFGVAANLMILLGPGIFMCVYLCCADEKPGLGAAYLTALGSLVVGLYMAYADGWTGSYAAGGYSIVFWGIILSVIGYSRFLMDDSL